MFNLIKPRKHQVEANIFILSDKSAGLISGSGVARGLLLHGTGTGKTITVLMAYRFLCNRKNKNLKALIIAPAGLTEDVWKPEIEKFGFDNFTVYSYSKICHKKNKHLLNEDYDFVYADEIHNINNYKSVQGRYLCRNVQHIPYRFAGTGTAKPRSYMDYFNPLYFCYGSEFHYEHNYYTWGLKYGKMEGHDFKLLYRSQLIKDVSPLVHVAKLKDCVDIPELTEENVFLEMSKEQKHYYDTFNMDLTEYSNLIQLQKTNYKRQIISDQFIKKEYGIIDNKKVLTGNIIEKKIWNTKLNKLLEILKDVPFRPVIIWCFYRDIAKYIYDNIPYEKKVLWNGGTKKNMEAWNNGEVEYLITSQSSMGEGYNLQLSNFSIFWLVDWGLTAQKQAIHRIVRSGQTRKQLIINMIYKGTLDEKILKLVNYKFSSLDYDLDSFQEEVIKRFNHEKRKDYHRRK